MQTSSATAVIVGLPLYACNRVPLLCLLLAFVVYGVQSLAVGVGITWATMAVVATHHRST